MCYKSRCYELLPPLQHEGTAPVNCEQTVRLQQPEQLDVLGILVTP